MTPRQWLITTVVSTTFVATAIAQPQSGGDRSRGPNVGSAATTPPRQTATVRTEARAFTDRNANSQEVFLVHPGDVVYPASQEGVWTLVENAEGQAGWVPTSDLTVAGVAAVASTSPAAPVGPPPKPRKPDPRIDMPVVLATPTGWLLPAAVLYSRTAIDTGGGVSLDNRVGLGDVAEFGLATSDNVRIKANDSAAPDRIQPYVTASFRMGVAENRLVPNQPGIVLGFRKSFERSFEGTKTRVAELTLVASKHLGPRAAIHLGGSFWDAEIHGVRPDGTAFVEALHDYGDRSRQLRAFGGVQVRPLDKSEILVDLGWAPEFCKACSVNHAIGLRPELSWGVRYQVADWMQIESGVRVPDIGNANLLNAQIFGQVTFTTWALRHKVDDLR